MLSCHVQLQDTSTQHGCTGAPTLSESDTMMEDSAELPDGGKVQPPEYDAAYGLSLLSGSVSHGASQNEESAEPSSTAPIPEPARAPTTAERKAMRQAKVHKQIDLKRLPL